MDSKGARGPAGRREEYLKRYEAWKQQQQLAKQVKTSPSRPVWNQSKPRDRGKNIDGCKLPRPVGILRRNTFEVKNSPIPVSLLPRVPRCGPPRKGAEKTTRVSSQQKENIRATHQPASSRPRNVSKTIPVESKVFKSRVRQSVGGLCNPRPVSKAGPNVDRRRSCVPQLRSAVSTQSHPHTTSAAPSNLPTTSSGSSRLPTASAAAAPSSLPSTSSAPGSLPNTSSAPGSLPFIRHTKTSLARMSALPEPLKGDYLERYNKWKAEKDKNKVNTNRPKTGVVKPPQSHVQTKPGQRQGIGKRPSGQKTSAAETTRRLRRKTISDLGKRSVTKAAPVSRATRRQTVSSSCLNQPPVTHKPAPTASTSLKRKELFPQKSATKKKRLDDGRPSIHEHSDPRPLPKRKTQSMLRQELAEWLKAKGKTPSRCRHLMCYGAHTAATGYKCPTQTKSWLSVEEISQQQRAIEQESSEVSTQPQNGHASELGKMNDKLRELLKECLSLQDMGCPVESLLSWLERIEIDLPMAVTSADFWICRAKLVQSTGDTNRVLEVFEQAVIKEAKPSDALAKELTEMVKEMTTGSKRYLDVSVGEEVGPAPTTPARHLREVQPDNIFESSSVKFCVKENTPLLKRMKDVYGMNGCSPSMIVTPVRRSTRKSLAMIPESLQEKDRVYESVSDIPPSEQVVSLYKANLALPIAMDTLGGGEDIPVTAVTPRDVW